jgi:hypothetical protein
LASRDIPIIVGRVSIVIAHLHRQPNSGRMGRRAAAAGRFA